MSCRLELAEMSGRCWENVPWNTHGTGNAYGKVHAVVSQHSKDILVEKEILQANLSSICMEQVS